MGGGIGMGKTCKSKAVSFQCMTKFTTNKNKKKKEKKRHNETKKKKNVFDGFATLRQEISVFEDSQ